MFSFNSPKAVLRACLPAGGPVPLSVGLIPLLLCGEEIH